ncbi:MAG: FAD-dependent oxidoreductase, partial [Microgenomates group bacterium]
MKIAILGGGFSGLTAGYYLAKKSHQVTIFEKEKILGGLASGFKVDNWDWYLERTVHHLFANDYHILNFAKEVGFNKIFFKEPETASLYKNPEFETLNSKRYQNPNVSNSKQKSFGHLNFSNWNLFRISNLEFRIFPLDTP